MRCSPLSLPLLLLASLLTLTAAHAAPAPSAAAEEKGAWTGELRERDCSST